MISINLKKRILTSLVLLIIFILIFQFNIFFVYTLIVLSTLSIIEFLNISKLIVKKKIIFFLANVGFLIFVFIFSLLLFLSINFIQLKIIIFSLILGCVGSDLGGFIIGKILKGPKLTKISPNKTISGFFGSLLFSNIFFSLSIFYFTNNFGYNYFIIGTLTSLFCQSGDLFFSLLKRKAKLKDTGNFLPGHGGILDRLDGIYFGVPLGFVSLIIFY